MVPKVSEAQKQIVKTIRAGATDQVWRMVEYRSLVITCAQSWLEYAGQEDGSWQRNDC
jgi:hypothetical protein